jgi:hypothetical protein
MDKELQRLRLSDTVSETATKRVREIIIKKTDALIYQTNVLLSLPFFWQCGCSCAVGSVAIGDVNSSAGAGFGQCSLICIRHMHSKH